MENINQNPLPQTQTDPNFQPTPPTNTPITRQFTKSNSIFLYIIIFLLVLVVGFLGYEVYSLKKLPLVSKTKEVSSTSTPIPSPAQINDPTSNWKTYTGQDLNFTFKYPSDVFINESFSEKYSLFLATENTDTVTEMSMNAVWMGVDIYTHFDAKELIKYTANKWIISYLPIKGAPTQRSFTATYLKGSVVYAVTMNSKTDASLDKFENTFNQILATFKFTQ